MIRSLPSIDEARTLVASWYEAGLEAVDPRAAIVRNLVLDENQFQLGHDLVSIGAETRIVAVAIGKAALAMAHGLDAVAGPRLGRRIILTKEGQAGAPPAGWEVFEASHPVPDQRAVDATRHILDALKDLARGDVVVVMISGGGSALLESPKPPLTLVDIQETTSLLLRAGAPIQHLNAVRSELSDVKGGGLRRVIGPATCISLILSDVLGNDPAVIASGPTISRMPDPDTALSLLGAYGIRDAVPPAVISLLEASSTPGQTSDVARDVFRVIGDNSQFLGRIEQACAADGYAPIVAWRNAEGEARDLAVRFVELVRSQPASVDVVLGGGEATVTVRGEGRGGRNTEFALAAAQRLAAAGGWVIASLASDGEDGVVDAAGAIVDHGTVARGAALGLDVERSLAANDSGGFLKAVGQLVAPGPTGTNVNDVFIAVRVAGSPAFGSVKESA